MILTKKNYYYFEKAKQVASLSVFPRYRFGSILVQKGKVLSFACNQAKTHPLQKRMNHQYRIYEGDSKYGKDVARLHSEINCLLHFEKDDGLSKSELYIYRMSKGGPAQARPCGACMARVRELGIRKIYYTTPDGYAFEEIG